MAEVGSPLGTERSVTICFMSYNHKYNEFNVLLNKTFPSLCQRPITWIMSYFDWRLIMFYKMFLEKGCLKS